MERAAVRRRLTWQLARVVELVAENARTTSLVLQPADWPGHRAGQHVDVRLTAEDGYQTQRSYSIASAPEDEHLVLTVERLDDGEVSPYLTETVRPGDELELRGPVGGFFVWEESLGGCQRAREFPGCAHENSPPSWAGLRAARSVCRRSRWRRMR